MQKIQTKYNRKKKFFVNKIMIIGIIDIGSNTVKGFVYTVHERSIGVISKKYIYAHLMSHVKNGLITDVGLQVLVSAVTELKSFMEPYGCDRIHAFATSAVRSAQNKEQIEKAVFDACGLSLEILSERDEAYYDFVSLRFYSPHRRGIGFDLGGGSGQIVVFDGDALTESVSFPIGALRMKNDFVRGSYPTEDEFCGIKRKVRELISKKIKPKRSERVLLIGGTAMTVLVLLRKLDEQTLSIRSVIRTDQLNAVKNALESMGPQKTEFLSRHAKGREASVLPGIAVLQAVAEYFGCKEFKVMKCGVREGYLIHNAMNKNSISQEDLL